jgi:hypothetical protein
MTNVTVVPVTTNITNITNITMKVAIYGDHLYWERT